MKHHFLVAPILFFAILVAALAGNSASAADNRAVVGIAATVAMLTPTPLPSPTPAAATQDMCAAPVAPTAVALPLVEYRKSCISIEDRLPADLLPGGALVMSGGSRDNRRILSMYHLDLMSLRKSPFPYSASRENASLSPDGKWLAYLDIEYDQKNHQKSRILQIANAEGRYLDMAYWGLNWQYLIGWQDEKHLVLEARGYPGGDFLILNPFTMEKKVVPVDITLPDQWHEEYYNEYLGLQEPVFPDPTLSRWAVFNYENTPAWILMNRSGWQMLWKGGTSGWFGNGNDPNWSPNGRYFTVMENPSGSNGPKDGWMLLRIGQDGKSAPLTAAIGGESTLAWSPDSRFVAGWLDLDPNAHKYALANRLVLIDVEKPALTDLCFENQIANKDYSYIDNTPPVWSPDGRYLAIGVSRVIKHEEHYGGGYTYTWTETIWDTALIDLQTFHAYRLAENARPLFWMRKTNYQ